MRHATLAAGIALAVTAAAAQVGTTSIDHNDFEWSAVAPVVVTATWLGELGRYHEFAIDQVMRGDVAAGQRVLVDVRQANRSRDRLVEPQRLTFEPGVRYAVLMQPTERVRGRDDDDRMVYWLVRGVNGVRELPAEGADARIAALRRYTEIQDMKSHPMMWHHMRLMLEETNPIMVATALDQYLKFSRSEVDLVPLLRPLLAHPRDDVREDAARVLARVVERHPDESLAAGGDVRAELAGLARRDPAEAVRIAATEALGEFDGPASDEILREVADKDPEQQVRYAAERILLERRRAAPAPN